MPFVRPSLRVVYEVQEPLLLRHFFLFFFFCLWSPMLTAVAYFATDDFGADLAACNWLIQKDIGAGNLLDASCMPDLVMVAKDRDDSIAGVLALSFTEGTHAWEILFVAAIGKYKHSAMMKFLVDGACSSIRIRYGGQHRSWLVRRIPIVDADQREWMKTLGFQQPEKWKQHVLCDEGFIAFDPFDQILMKRQVGL